MDLGAFLFSLVIGVVGLKVSIDFYNKGEIGVAVTGFIISGFCLLVVVVCIYDMFKKSD